MLRSQNLMADAPATVPSNDRNTGLSSPSASNVACLPCVPQVPLAFRQCSWSVACSEEPKVDSARRCRTARTSVNEDRSAILTCERDQGDVAFTESIPMTDFPLDHITIWLEPGVTILDGEERQVMVMLLPSEH